MAAAISRIRSLPVGADKTDWIAHAPYARPITLHAKTRSRVVAIFRTFWRALGEQRATIARRRRRFASAPQEKDGGSYAKARPLRQAAQGVNGSRQIVRRRSVRLIRRGAGY